jgi:hypothetical protein
VGKCPRKSFPPPRELPRVQKSAKTKGYRPTCARTRLPGYRRLPVLFAPVVNLSLHVSGRLAIASCPPAPGGPEAVVQKDGQPALSPHHRPKFGPDDGFG